jgi:catechol 2,3-dioxygenase-like lactoylglutathione lyase family enzyme
MQLQGLVRIVLLVRDIDASLRFYRDDLGLRPRRPPAGGWVELDSGACRLCLHGPWEGMPYDPADFGRSPDELLLGVDDLDAAVAALGARGHRPLSVHEPGPGLRVAEYADPDGRRVALEERREETPG